MDTVGCVVIRTKQGALSAINRDTVFQAIEHAAYLRDVGTEAVSGDAGLFVAAPMMYATLCRVRDYWCGGDAPETIMLAIEESIAKASSATRRGEVKP